MFKKKITNIKIIEKIFNLKNKLISKFIFTKNKKKGGNPDKDKNNTKNKVLNFENLFI